MLKPGMFLQGRYEILEQIGSGGMSDVYKARCHKLNRLVAIKVLKQEFSSDSNFVGRFKMEAQAAARLSHPNIVNVYDVIDEGTIHYIVMELIEGITLKNYIAKKGRLGVKETIGISLQVAQGMAAAHEQHIIHRDIKPQNMIISKEGKVKVADFGIARAVSSQTMSSNAMGSVHYISPEQAKGLYSDERSDIYSFGITMYEMVTGRVPFEGDNTVTVALAHLEDPITPPSDLNPNIPQSLENIILKCTQKSPDMRYNSATEVISDLRKALLNPDEEGSAPVIPPVRSDISANTVVISEREMNQIKEGKRTNEQPNRQRTAPPSQAKRHEENDNINPQLEKLLTAAGIIAAILIVCVVVFVFAKLGDGIFNKGSSTTEALPTQAQTTEETISDKQTIVPESILGLPVDVASTRLKEDTLVLKVIDYRYSDEYGEGDVMGFSEDNPVGSVVNKYSKVGVYVSKGSDAIDLSTLSLVGMDVTAAQKLLEQQNIAVNISEEENTSVAKGQVIRYSPEKVKPGESVGLVISTGAPVKMVNVPNIAGKTRDEADKALKDAGLTSGTVSTSYHETIAKDVVISQEIADGTQLEEGTAVNYVVSDGLEPMATAASSAYKYVASIAEDYEIKNVFGPGSAGSSLQVSIRLRQHVNGKDEYTTLMQPQTVTGDQVLPVRFSGIEGADSVTEGFVEVVDASNGTVLRSYPLTFVALPRT